jgi:hypothetical protein
MTNKVINEKGEIYLTPQMIHEWDIHLLRALVDNYKVITNQQGMQMLQQKDIEATMAPNTNNQLSEDLIKTMVVNELNDPKPTKSSKGKHPTNRTPPKRKRRR